MISKRKKKDDIKKSAASAMLCLNSYMNIYGFSEGHLYDLHLFLDFYHGSWGVLNWIN